MSDGDPGRTTTPSSMGDIAGRSWSLCREHFLTLVSVGAIPWLLMTLVFAAGFSSVAEIVTFVFGPYADNFGFYLILVVPLACAALLFIFLIGQGALIHAITSILVGSEVRVGQAYRFSLRKIGRIVGASFSIAFLPVLVAFVVMCLTLVVIAVCYLLDSAEPPGSTGQMGALVLFVLIYVYSSAKTALFDKVIFLESAKEASTPLRRSWKLVRGKADGVPNILRSFFFLAIASGAPFAVALILPKVVRKVFVWAGVPGNHFLAEWGFPVLTIFGPLAATLFGSVGLLLLYFDIRLRSEGFDPKAILQDS